MRNKNTMRSRDLDSDFCVVFCIQKLFRSKGGDGNIQDPGMEGCCPLSILPSIACVHGQ